jgi:hypothetical protein
VGATSSDGSAGQPLADAWGDLLDGLRDAADTILGPNGAQSALEEAEGFRFLTRLASAALDMFVEYGDTAHPAFVRLMTNHRKFYGDNPDTFYDYASIQGRRRYRIAGTRGTTSYLAFCIYGRTEGGQTRIVANVSDRDLPVDSEGRFELVMSLDEPRASDRATWVKLEPDVEAVIARQYFLDHDTEHPAEFTIVCEDDVPVPGPLQIEPLARRLRAAGEFVRNGTTFSAHIAHDLAARPNEVTVQSEAAAVAAFYPTPDNKYVGGWYRLGADDALVVEGTPPDTRYWSLLLMSRWMESLDTEHHQTLINKHQATLEPDGSFRIVVAHQDPGIPNWLDTAGHTQGYVMFRWMQATGITPPTFRVARLDQLS